MNGLRIARIKDAVVNGDMTEEMLGKIVPVKLFSIEKKSWNESAAFIGSADNRSTYSINLLYENTVDPADNVHKFGLLPENPNFIKIKDALEQDKIDDIKEFPLSKLSESLHDMYGAWILVDMSATPVCRVYSENVCKIVGGQVKTIHKAGDLMHKKDPATGEDSAELAIMTQVPVWGFCRKAPNGNWIWLKGNDPMARIQREINQGRLRYVEEKKAEPVVEEKVDEAKSETSSERPTGPVGEAPDLGNIS
jgi:hypothetical protein